MVRPSRRVLLALLALLITTLPAAAAPLPPTSSQVFQPAAPPAGFTDQVVPGLNAINEPTAFAFTPDRLMLITARRGQLWIYENGSLRSSPALDLSNRLCIESERGLLGVAVDPDFLSNHYIYLYYTFKKNNSCATRNNGPQPVNRVARFRLDGNSAVDETILVDNIPSPNGNHNAGDLQFGKDGYLYISVGDGGWDADSGSGGSNDAARDSHTLPGKILRITRDGAIPPDNPFQGANTDRCYDPAPGGNTSGQTTPGRHCRETFAWGLRNPFRFAMDPNAEGTRFLINDVGQNRSEEINEGRAGADYGWNCYEGTLVNNQSGPCNPLPSGSETPIFEYRRGGSESDDQPAFFDGCNSITGGAFVPNGIWPAAFDGAYLFADFICGKMFSLTRNQQGAYQPALFSADIGGNSVTHMAFGTDGDGMALYYADYVNGEIRIVRYVGNANRSPEARFSAVPSFGEAPLQVQFDGGASSDPDGDQLVAYAWDFGDGQHASGNSPLVSHQYQQVGVYTATLTVEDSRGARSPLAARLRIDVGNTPPQVELISPAPGERFRVGQQFILRGSAVDPQDGPLSGASLNWEVRRHHDEHYHPYLVGSGSELALTAPPPEDLAAAENSYLEIRLSAADSLGRTTTITRELQPHKVNLSFNSEPPGLSIRLFGDSYAAPRNIVSWADYALQVSLAETQQLGDQSLRFCAWSHGAAASHTLITPAGEQSYTAIFKPADQPCPEESPAPNLVYLPIFLR